ncbi:unnamed protein product [Oppiella nova]|uniref:Uncharacterized protein n=1 Tax=Oppiella nova TaxID=334625 RepID=A0A7R9MGR1_9ACAR|nr:unnamed protein product [Oppiella nova]CAG2176934.1 unnamed protein product [Oppiella nova]
MVARSFHRSTQSLGHYSSSLSRYAPKSTEFKVIKYTLVVFMILNIFSSIWVCIYIGWQTDFEMGGTANEPSAKSAVNSWYICSMFFVIFADLVDIILLFGVWADKKPWVIALCVLSFIFSIYGISSVYLRGSITCFVIPFCIFTLSVLMIWLIRHEEAQYDVQRGPGLRTAVKRF